MLSSSKTAELQSRSDYKNVKQSRDRKLKTFEESAEECRKYIAKTMPRETLVIQDPAKLKRKTEEYINLYVDKIRPEVEGYESLADLRADLIEEITEYGPITQAVYDDNIDEIQINAYNQIFVESEGKREVWRANFTDNDQLEKVIAKLIRSSKQRLTSMRPFVNARTAERYRVNATHSEISPYGNYTVTLRKFKKKKLTPAKLISSGSMTRNMYGLVRLLPKGGTTWMTVGATASGKTTLNEVIAREIPDDERVILIENPAEYDLVRFGQDGYVKNNIVGFEAKNIADAGPDDPTMENLMTNALRQSPEWLGVGELRAPGEFRLGLTAGQTGHKLFSTFHAENAEDCLFRYLTAYCAESNEPPELVLRNICSVIKFIIVQEKLKDGTRKIIEITEVLGSEGLNVNLNQIYIYEVTGVDEATGKIEGRHKRVGKLSRKMQQKLLRNGIPKKYFEEYCLDVGEDGEVDDNYSTEGM